MGSASPLSLAATGLGAAKTIDSGFTGAGNQRAQAQQTAQMDEFRAQQLANGAQYAQAQGSEVDTYMRQQVMQHLGSIQAVAAASNTDASSPTTAAILARTQGQSDQQRSIQVGNLQAQSAEDAAESYQYTNAAQQTLNRAYANSGSDIFGGFLGGLGSIATGLSGIKLTG